MIKAFDIRLVRFIIGALVTAVAAGTWDIWWHAAIGRDTFFEPPHLLLYAAVIAAIIAGAIGWRRTREATWRHLAWALIAIPLAAPFDELWHRVFGVEQLSSPLIIWSPSHLVLVAAVLAGLALALPRLAGDRVGRNFFGALAIAGGATLLFFVVTPLFPLGPYRLFGPWGAFFTTAVMIGPFIAAQTMLGGFARAVSVAAFLSLFHVVQFHTGSAFGVIVPFHAHPPAWLAIAAILIPAILLDLTRKLPEDARGGAAGLVMGVLLFAFISHFDQAFLLSRTAVIAAITASAAGGVLGGFFARQFARPLW